MKEVSILSTRKIVLSPIIGVGFSILIAGILGTLFKDAFRFSKSGEFIFYTVLVYLFCLITCRKDAKVLYLNDFWASPSQANVWNVFSYLKRRDALPKAKSKALPFFLVSFAFVVLFLYYAVFLYTDTSAL
ncbi:MAG: hypothetical protein EOM53_04255 [Alphaproteobacteria bacterium]|nr:hypothetical protein [Alphaproteobacteria bacterium]